MSKKGEHPHHGGAWKVAYADFVTAMMALFIVLWILGADAKKQAAVATYFRHPSVLPNRENGYLDKAGVVELGQEVHKLDQEASAESSRVIEAAAKELTKQGPISREEVAERGLLQESAKELEHLLDSNEILSKLKASVKIEFTSQGMRIQIQDLNKAPLFAVGSSEPTAAASALLRGIAGVLKDLPNNILVEGHTDRRPYSGKGNYTNWELSGDRANAARRVLETGGIAAEKMARVVGYADRRLLLPDDPMSDQNRRISITVCYPGQPSE